MGLLIDSSVLIGWERGARHIESRIAGRENEELLLSAITASELLHGVHRASNGRRRATREAFVEAILAALPILPFDMLVARTHARLWADLAAAGRMIGAHDLLIAASAVAHGLRLATLNVRDFGSVDGLVVEDWSVAV